MMLGTLPNHIIILLIVLAAPFLCLSQESNKAKFIPIYNENGTAKIVLSKKVLEALESEIKTFVGSEPNIQKEKLLLLDKTLKEGVRVLTNKQYEIHLSRIAALEAQLQATLDTDVKQELSIQISKMRNNYTSTLILAKK